MNKKSTSKDKKFFSLVSSIVLILSILLVGISIHIPNASALDMDKGNLHVDMLTDYGRILYPIEWGSPSPSRDQTVQDISTLGFIGLVIDHDNYDHTPGVENISDSFSTPPYMSSNDFQSVNPISMIIDSSTTQKSYGSFQNEDLATGFPDDILIEQTAWSEVNKDWVILQWTLNNVKSPASDLTNVRIGLEVPISKEGGRFGLGGNLDDGGDDVDAFDGINDVYWAQDLGDGTTLGFGSAIVSDPITHYYAEDYHADYSTEYVNFFASDSWLYQRISSPSQTSTDGVNPENITATVGWDGFDIASGESRTVTLVIAINDSYNNMINAIKDAQFYYQYVATGFQITEIRDSGSASARVEVFNNGREPLVNPGSLLSLTSNSAGLLTGTWSNDPIPTYGYSYLDISGGSIDAEGDTITLEENGVPIDQVSFGQDDIAPDPVAGESVARRFDTSINGYSNIWLRDPNPTWDSQNDVGNIVASPLIVINRVLFNPFAGDEEEMYVELMYTGFAPGGINIWNYRIVCDDVYFVPSVTLTPTDRFYVFRYSDMPAFFTDPNGMTPAADNVYLYTFNEDLLDMVGWSSAHNQGEFMSRSPDGFGTYQGYNDATSITAGWIFDQTPSLMLTEFYADSTFAQIELYNPRGGDKVLSPRWTLDVSGVALTGNWNNPTITWKGYEWFTRTGGGSPGNEGDTINLYYQSTNLMDQVAYGTSGVAPDPLSGESTARYWDTTILGYTNDWTRNASTGPTFGFQNDVAPISSSPAVILNEVMFDPTNNPAGYYLWIINIGSLSVDLADYSIVCDGVFQFSSQTFDPGWMMMINYSNAPQIFNNIDFDGDNVYLYNSNGGLADMVGWDNPHALGMSVRRVPDGSGTYQGYDDVTSVAASWVFNSPLEVYVTEISDDDSGTPEIEIYNPWYPTIDFSTGFTYESNSGALGINWIDPTAASGEYAYGQITTGNLASQGDTLSFKQNTVLIEDVSYGTYGTVPDPLPGESVERYWDGAYYTDVWERNWTSGPSFGAQNNVPPDNLSSSIILNEVLFNPNAVDDHFVEIYNLGTIPINISGYKLVCNTEYIIPDGTRIEFNNFFYLLYGMDNAFFDNMLSSGDDVYLYNENGSLIDMVGWDSPHTVGRTVCRIPDGNGTRDGYDDISSVIAGWHFDQIPSISLIQIEPDSQQYGQNGDNVTYLLNIYSKHYQDHLVDISNITGPWGWEVIIQNMSGNPLNDTNGNGLPDIFVNAGGRAFIIVVVKIPTSASPGASETTIITAKSAFNSFFIDNATLITRVKTIQTVTFPVGSFVIPMDDKQNDVLKAFGFVHALLRNGSVIYRIIEPPDIVISTNLYPLNEVFAGGPILVMPSDASIVNAVRSNFPSVTLDITIKSFTSDKVDVIYSPTNILLIYGVYGHTQDVLTNMEIPFTMVYTSDVANDPDMLFNYDLIIDDCPGWGGSVPSTVANNMQILAEQGGEVIFTDIALRDLDAVYPGHIPVTSNIDGTWPCSVYRIPEFPGQYYGPSTLDIFTMGAGQIMMAPTDPNVRIMVDCNDYSGDYRVLAAYFYYGSGIYSGGVVEGFGYHPGDQPPDARVLASIFFGNKFVHLPPQPVIPDIIPPTLYIKTVGDDILLNWTQPTTEGLSHYLIYRSTSQIGFDFSNIWVNTSLHNDSGIIPLRTTWNDTGAASGNAPQEYYYVIRAVFESDGISHTSRTVGKWTKIFPKGMSTFSLPLEPLENLTIDYCLNDMNAKYIKWMHPGLRKWMKHGDGGVNDTQMKLGEGYEVKFDSQTNHTFTGMPGAMIIYDDDNGFLGFNSDSEAKNLTVTLQSNGDVNLTWQEPSSMDFGDWYEVYNSSTRDGFFGTRGIHYFLACPLISYGADTAIHIGAQANNPGTRLYYMVVPFNASDVRGASTYSIGVWTEEYLNQYDTFGIPLKQSNYHKADWYCDNIPNTVGINYFNITEQRWCWHSTRMPGGAYDPILEMTVGYQISTSSATKFIFVGW